MADLLDKAGQSYSDVLTNKNKQDTPPISDVNEVKPVFISEDDLFGSEKPSREQFLTHVELYKSIDLLVPASHLKGLQRVREVWRRYLDNHDDKTKVLSNGIVIRKKLIQVYSRNPKMSDYENPLHISIRIKNVPCSADDGQIRRVLEQLKCKVHDLYRERLRVDGRLTNCQTGDRIVVCDPLDHPFPRAMVIGKYRATILHKEQVDTQYKITCNKCLQDGHKLYQCPNDWVCKTCGGSGHKSMFCSTNIYNESSFEGSGSDTESDTDGESDHSMEETQMPSQSILDTNAPQEKVRTIIQANCVQSDIDQKSDNNTHSNKEIGKQTTEGSTSTPRHKKKAKRGKTPKQKLDQHSIEQFLANTMKTPTNSGVKANVHNKTRNKQGASTPTNELHERTETTKKQKS